MGDFAGWQSKDMSPPLGLELHPGMQANLVKLFIFLTGMHRGDLRPHTKMYFHLRKEYMYS